MTIEEVKHNYMEEFVKSGGKRLDLFIIAQKLEKLAENIYNIGLVDDKVDDLDVNIGY